MDEFNDKVNKEILLRTIPNRADDTRMTERGMTPYFPCSKNKKKKKQREKRKEFQTRNYEKAVTKVKMLPF